jgi:hypothetical protein
MKLKVIRGQTDSSGVFGGKKHSYTLKVVADMTEDENHLLQKYGLLDKLFHIDPEISAEIEVRKEIKGPPQISVAQLRNGIEWSCGYLPVGIGDVLHIFTFMENDKTFHL